MRRHHWAWVADNVKPQNPSENNAIEKFRRRLIQIANLVVEHPQESVKVAILRQDAKALALRDSSVDPTVTSPPYVGVIDYARASR
ncbi:hypothetical protein FPK48_22330, partial [Acinetobacter baumannii]|nr:hypothetical protein [Acinetobacter baumannii]